MKLHVGCGSVLLREWVNVDLPLPTVFLAKERPDLVERFVTTEDAYYARHQDKTPESLRNGPVTGETVCDVFGSFTFLPARAGTVSEILSIQVFEHLNSDMAALALDECRRVLQRGGILRLDVPDPDETIQRYLETGDKFYVRHLYGPRRDVFGCHTHYTRAMLKALVEDHGFRFVLEETHNHFYPAMKLRFEKK